MKYIEQFPFEHEVIEEWIPLSDGTKLWMKRWMPQTNHPVPAILEYLPYRAGDWTAPRDYERHPFYAGHGYASIRVDIRGHGNSEGVPGDEYSPQEHADGVEVINWIAQQDWCTGNVGMFGISWGGFNSLQLAALHPEPLKAIVTTCSTDDRYDNDVHYLGGSMLGVDMHAWAATMLAFESRPLDKRVWGEKWREKWEYRLNRMEPYIDTWLSHQRRDSYWEHGSVCEDYSQINAAVMAVGGWYDPYRDTVLRLCEHLSALDKNVKGLLGPWSHQYPDRDLRPGPHIDFLNETLRWWDHWLKEKPNDVVNEPLLRTWITDPIPPRSVYDEMPGRWVAETSWPSPNIVPTTLNFEKGSINTVKTNAGHVLVDSPHDTGQAAGRYFPYGNAADLPVDQRADDGRSVTVDFEVTESFEILGNAKLKMRVKTPASRGQLYARLNDVSPAGESTLVTRGALNLSSREGRDKAVPMPTDEWVDVEFAMTGIGYHFAAGHVLRIAISNAYWPWIWPQPDSGVITLDLTGSHIELPVRPIPAADSERAKLDAAIHFDEAVQPVPLDVKYPEAGLAGSRRPERLICTDVVAKTTLLQVDPAYGGTRIYPDGLHFDEDSVERYWIQWDDPTTARTESQWRIKLERPELDWQARVEADTRITCDDANFYTESDVKCYDGDEEIFAKVWKRTIPREAS